VSYLSPKDIFSLAPVCKKYNDWSKIPEIWKNLSEREGIPLVVNLDGTPRTNPKDDFRVLYPITISSKIIGQFFGKVVGSVPPISQYWFDLLNQPDPYEKEKLGQDNYVVVVEPSLIQRSVNEKTPFDIDESGNLTEVHPQLVINQEFTIPFSLNNLRLLCKHPLKGNEHLPVFSYNFLQESLDQGGSFPEKLGVFIMRRSIVNDSIMWSTNKGFEITPFRIRALADAIFILRSGTCPDGCTKEGFVYARTADRLRVNKPTNRIDRFNAIGGFNLGSGLQVDDVTLQCVDDEVGVVPYAPAGVAAMNR
jgi:hypothetical protein